MHQNELEGLLKPRLHNSSHFFFWDKPALGISESGGLSGSCLSHKFPVLMMLLVQGTHLWDPQLLCPPSSFHLPSPLSFPIMVARATASKAVRAISVLGKLMDAWGSFSRLPPTLLEIILSNFKSLVYMQEQPSLHTRLLPLSPSELEPLLDGTVWRQGIMSDARRTSKEVSSSWRLREHDQERH